MNGIKCLLPLVSGSTLVQGNNSQKWPFLLTARELSEINFCPLARRHLSVPAQCHLQIHSSQTLPSGLLCRTNQRLGILTIHFHGQGKACPVWTNEYVIELEH